MKVVSGDEEAIDAPARSTIDGFVRLFATEWPALCSQLRRSTWAKAHNKHSGGFLYRTARNLLIDRKRRLRRLHLAPVEGLGESVVDDRPSPEDEVHWRMELERVGAVFDRMSPKCRNVFILRVVDGYSYAEISERLGMTKATVERHLLRAFVICAEWTQKDGGTQRRRRGA